MTCKARCARLAWSALVAGALVGTPRSIGADTGVEGGRSSAAPVAAREPARTLRVCSDPNNLPFSNEREEGFENRLAALLARALDARLEYTWWAQGRGFFRNTINARRCDLVMGVPKQIELVDTTDTIYRSSYVFVTVRGSGQTLSSLDDPALAALKIGVHVIGDDYTNTPPVHALGNRGLIDNLVGYRINGDYAEPNPPARLVEAVARGDVDVAIVWGPLGGYFARRQAVPLSVRRVMPGADAELLPLSYDIALGVRRGEPAFKAELNRVLGARRRQVRQILRDFGVPVVKG